MELVGLDYGSVFRVAELYGESMTVEVFEGVQSLEADVLREQHERAEEWRKTKKSHSR